MADEIEVEICNEDESALLPGTLLCGGRYRIVRFLSSGGFGKTYEAEHVLLHKRIAVKEFFPRDMCNRDKVTSHVTVGTESKRKLVEKLHKKFVQEAQAVAQFSHPGIVKVSDVFEENGTAYYVMDYIEGGSLRDKVKSLGSLSEVDAVRYIRQVCDALEYVHSKNCLHLDIKPGNIMVGPDGHAILIDFGSSKQYDEVSGENTSTLLGYTAGYAPPEQTAQVIRTFYPATDIYAVGATLYNLLTGKVPVESSSRSSGEELDPLPANISAGTRAAVEAAMLLNKNLRPQSVDEFLALLDGGDPKPKPKPVKPEDTEVTEVKPTKPPKPPVPSPQPESKPSDSHRSTLLAILVGALVAVVIGVWGYLATRQSGGGGGGDTEITDTEVTDSVAADSIESESLSPLGRHSRPEEIISLQEEAPTSGINVEGNSPKHTTNQTSTAASGSINGHEWVDLGLSVKWATCNVGASSPEEYGNFYAWGETKTKSVYCSDNSIADKYLKEHGRNMRDFSGNPKYDAARANWGGTWRMPTELEVQELIKNCSYMETTLHGVKGSKFVSKKNGNSIFIPMAGCVDGHVDTDYYAGGGGASCIWTSTPGEGNDNTYVYYVLNNTYTVWCSPYNACSVRPVTF